MPSFNVINYSIRPSKSIQRQIVFECLERLNPVLGLGGSIYLGFGSVWFTDFVLAHNRIGVNRMVSIECDDIGYRRASFNRPYSVVDVHHGHSNAILPELLDDERLRDRPWIVWLDYDFELNKSIVEDLRNLVQGVPANSVLIFTVNAVGNKYGNPDQRPDYLKYVLGDVVPDDLAKKQCRDPNLQLTLAKLSTQYLQSVAAEINRPGGFVPAFQVPYKDGAAMATFGGILPNASLANQIEDVVQDDDWKGRVIEQIQAPHLTVREASGIQSLLPSKFPIMRDQIKALGFDLTEGEIAVFQKYYKQYPSFAQVVL